MSRQAVDSGWVLEVVRGREVGRRLRVPSGSAVLGNEVRLSKVAVAHGNLQIVVSEDMDVVQPGPFTEAETVEVPRTDIGVDEENKQLMLMEGATLQELVDGLNAIGAAPRDLISIIRTLKAAGALHAELEVI